MQPQLRSKVYLIGTYQAVSEAAMSVWASGVLVNLSSDGIRALDAEAESGCNLHILECTCDQVTGSAGVHCEGLSREFPHVLVGLSVVGSGFDDVRPDHCVWGASAHLGGIEVVAGLTGSLPSSLPPDVAALVDDSAGAGAIPGACVPRLHIHALERFETEARGRLNSVLVERWSPLTRSVAARGLAGFTTGLGSERSATTRLTMASQSAHKAGTASWVDTLMFASRDSGSTGDHQSVPKDKPTPFSSADVAAWPERHVALLRAVAKADLTDKVMGPVVEAITSPWVRFQSGEHPMPWLVTRPIPEGDAAARAGLKKLVDLVGTHGDSYDAADHLPQAVRAIRLSGFTSESIRLAERMGLSPGHIASRVLPLKSAPAAEQQWAAGRLIDGFKGLYGDIANFPEELARAFADQSEPVARAFESRKTEELMASAIANWRPASGAPSTNVTVTVKRRRSMV
jgi:hypothetical protein